jgi:MoxR-vWA-beta-propeller ternary system domain bpX5
VSTGMAPDADPAAGAITIDWEPRAEPLAPVAVAALGPAAQLLARRVLAGEDEALVRLRGVAGDRVLVLLGEAEALPWADGAVYLGQEASAPGLLVPTTRAPAVPLPLFEQALRRRFGDLAPPLAVLVADVVVLSVAEARPVARDLLQAWLEGQS